MTLKTKIYHKMRELLERGWIKRSFAQRADGKGSNFADDQAAKFCLVGARERAVYLLTGQVSCPEALQVSRELHEYIQKRYPTRGGAGGDIISFNDAPVTTKEEVLEIVTVLENRSYNG